MSKIIDADALMKDICDSINWMTDIGLAVDGDWLWAKLNDAIDNAPAIESKQRWIPMTERPPDLDERVLVITNSYNYFLWDCTSNRGDNYFWKDESGYYHNKNEVTAWMPLFKTV